MKTWIIRNEQEKDRFIDQIRSLPLDRPKHVAIKDYKKKRSLEQNAAFHAWMTDVSRQYAESTGEFYAPEVWKEYFKRLFLGEETIEIKGKKFDRVRHSSRLSVPEMRDFMDQVQNYCGSELNILLTTDES